MYLLYGSFTSPYVRRLRILLLHHGLPFEFQEMNIYETEGNEILEKINPIKQIPVFKDNSQVIWDSRHIYRYLAQKHHWPHMSWEEENVLTAIERGLDSCITMFLLQRSGVDLSAPMMFKDRQLSRVENILHYLEPWIKAHGHEWNFHSMTLYSWLVWADFRGILDLNHFSFTKKFISLHDQRTDVIKTQIPQG